MDETHSTLRFASRAKTITNKPLVNESISDETLLKRYRREISQLKQQLTELKSNETQPESGRQSRNGVDENQLVEDEEKKRLRAQLENLNQFILNGTLIRPESAQPQNKKIRHRRQTWFPGTFSKHSSTSEDKAVDQRNEHREASENESEVPERKPCHISDEGIKTLIVETPTDVSRLLKEIRNIIEEKDLTMDEPILKVIFFINISL